MPEAQQKIEEPEVEVAEEEVQISDEDLLSAIDEELSDERKPEAEAQADADAAAERGDEQPDPGDSGRDVPEGTEEVQAKPAETEGDEKPEGEKPVPDVETKPEPEPAKDTKPSDEFGELDKDVPEKTRERFNTMKSRFDELAAERDAVRTENQAVRVEVDKWKAAVQDATKDPKQFGTMLTVLKKMNSTNPSDLEDAYAMLKSDLDAIGKVLGKPINGADPLAEYPDLKEKVDDGMLDPDSAMEIAQARASKKLSAVARQQTEQQTEQQRSVQKAMEDVKALGAELSQNDPDFQAKIPYLTPIIESVVSSGAPASSWVNAIRIAVAKIPVTKAPPPAPRPSVPNPIRPTGASPGNAPMQREPGSEMEALNQALERGF